MFNENFFEDIINSIEPCICIYNRQGVIIYFNNSFRDRYLEDNKTFEDLTFDDINSEEYKSISHIKEVLEEESVVSRQKQYYSEGRFQITTTPFDGPEQQSLIIETILRPYKNTSDNIDLSPNGAILEDEAMKNILEAIFRISNFDSTILISGESGTGKSMLANFIHKNSKRAKEPFVTINCATIPENLIESELFGYVSGAFTGANQKGKKGRVELANKGTLFLDEIGLLPIHLQSKFLQLIQEKTYMPVGAIKSRKVDIRIISATNLNLKKQISANKFREDLFYRLRVIEFNIPPLRERIDAIEPLIDHFINHFNNKYQIKKPYQIRQKKF